MDPVEVQKIQRAIDEVQRLRNGGATAAVLWANFGDLVTADMCGM